MGQPRRLHATNSAAQYGVAGDGRPSLQRVSDDLNESISTVSRNLTGVLNSAVGEGSNPVKVKISAFGTMTEIEFSPETPVDQVIGDIMRKSQTIRPPQPSQSSGGRFRGGPGGSRIRSSSRRSGGGCRRGFR